MKRALTSALILVILAVVGLLLLTVSWSAGSESDPVALNTQTSDSTSPIAVTLTYSQYLTLTDGDIWSMPTPVHTPIIPTERPFLPKPTWPTMTPRPTPTLLPDLGVRLTEPVEIPTGPALQIAGEEGFRLVYPDLDGHILVGAVNREDRVAAVIINLKTGQRQVLIQESKAAIDSPRISEGYIVWSISWRDGARNILQVYDLKTNQTLNIAEGAHKANISNNTVIWEQVGDGWDIWGYDMTQLEAFPVVARPNSQTGSLISGRWVIYRDTTDRSEAGVGFHAINLDTGEDFRLGTVFSSSDQYVPPLYAIDAPWVAWSSEAKLHLYNLDTHTTYTTTVEPCIAPATEPWTESRLLRPEYLAISGQTVIFSCSQWMGYDIERKVFFSLPIRSSAITKGYFAGWDISGDRLVWVLTEDSYGPQEQSHIYTAQIERSP